MNFFGKPLLERLQALRPRFAQPLLKLLELSTSVLVPLPKRTVSLALGAEVAAPMVTRLVPLPPV